MLLTELFGVDVETSCPNLLILLLFTHGVIARACLGLFNLLEVATLLLDLFLQEFAANSDVSVVQNLVEILAYCDSSTLESWIELVDRRQVTLIIFEETLVLLLDTCLLVELINEAF